MLLGAELTIPVLERSPQIPTGDGAVRTPFRADPPNILGRRSLSLSISALDGVLDSKIQFGQDVTTLQTKHQEHLRRPAADAFDLNKVCDEIVVVHTINGVERQCALRHFGRKIAHVANFLTRQPDGAEIGVARGQHGVGRRRAVGIERVESRKDRRRGFSGQLLEHDRANERLEMRSFAARLQSARTDDFDYSREDRVDALEMADCGAEVSHAENLRLGDAPRPSVCVSFARTRATFRMSAMNIRSASAR